MGNCLPCQKRGGRRRRGRRRRRTTRVHPDYAADTEHIHIVLSNSSNQTRRHLSKGEAKMERALRVNGEEPKVVPASMAYVIGPDSKVRDYNPELNEVIKGISDALDSGMNDQNENVFTIEEEAMMEEILEKDQIEAARQKLADKQKQAELRRKELLKKRKKKPKLDFTAAVINVPPDNAGTSDTHPVPDNIGTTDAAPENRGHFTTEEEKLMADIVEEDDLRQQKLQQENKMNEAIARRERLLAKRAKKAKRLAKRETVEDEAPVASDSTEVKTVEPTTSGHFTTEEEKLMTDIVEEDDIRQQKLEQENKMNEAIARREILLAKRAKKAKRLAKRETVEDEAPVASDATEVKTVEPTTSQQYSVEEERMMEDIVTETDLKQQKLDLDNKMSEAIAKRQKILERKAKKAKRLATREKSDDTAPVAAKADTVDADTIEIPTCSTTTFTKDDEKLMQDIVDEEDTKEMRDKLGNKMAGAEARRERALRSKVKKAKKMTTSGHVPSPEPGTSASGCKLADNGEVSITVKKKDKITEVVDETVNKVKKDEQRVESYVTKFSVDEELLMDDILDEFGDDDDGGGGGGSQKGEGHSRIGQG